MAAEGTGQKVLAYNKFKDMIVDVPDEEEQIKIGAIFEYVDNLIAQHQSKLEKLQSSKHPCWKKCFQKMVQMCQRFVLRAFPEPGKQSV